MRRCGISSSNLFFTDLFNFAPRNNPIFIKQFFPATQYLGSCFNCLLIVLRTQGHRHLTATLLVCVYKHLFVEKQLCLSNLYLPTSNCRADGRNYCANSCNNSRNKRNFICWTHNLFGYRFQNLLLLVHDFRVNHAFVFFRFGLRFAFRLRAGLCARLRLFPPALSRRRLCKVRSRRPARLRSAFRSRI